MEESPLAQSASMIWNSSFDNLGVGKSFSYACLIFYYICLLSSRTSPSCCFLHARKTLAIGKDLTPRRRLREAELVQGVGVKAAVS
jgi:hypothetical protein